MDPKGAVRRMVVFFVFVWAAPALAETSTSQNPAVTFSEPGTKQVQLTVCNSGGCSTLLRTIQVLDPNPSTTTFEVTPLSVVEGDFVYMSGAGAGAPPLSYQWRVLDSGSNVVQSVAAATGSWLTLGFAPGIYAVYLDVTNSFSTYTTSPALVTVEAYTGLFRDSFETGLVRWQTTG